MEFCFDALFIKDNTLHAIGWTVGSVEGNPIRILAYGSHKKELSCQITRAIRPDVGLAKFGNPKSNDIGIFLQIPYPRDGYVQVCFSEIDAASQTVIHSQSVSLTRAHIQMLNFYNKSKETLLKPEKLLQNWLKELPHSKAIHYTGWLCAMRSDSQKMAQQRTHTFAILPSIDILLPVWNGPARPLTETVLSVLAQTYPHWNLFLLPCGRMNEAFSSTLNRFTATDPRIHLLAPTEDCTAVSAYNEAAHPGTGDYIALLKQNDVLEEEALYEYVNSINTHASADLLYCDEDQFVSLLRSFFNPHMKSDFNKDLLYSYDYMRHFLMIHRSRFEQMHGFSEERPGAWEYDFVLRFIEQKDIPVHVPRPLYHVRITKKLHPAHAYDESQELDALNDHYKRLGLIATAVSSNLPNCHVTSYELSTHPLVSVLIPNKDHTEDLDICLRSLLNGCTYDNLEVIVIENNSTEPETFAYYEALKTRYDRIQVITWKGSGFNYSAINNYGFSKSHGEYILLLNNDVEVITPNLLESLLGYCMRPEVGIVGARLLFDDNTVQHAGVLVGAGGPADHVFKGYDDAAPGYMNRSLCSQDLSAVTAACLMVKRSVYQEVNGLDETFAVAYNDVDFCLKVRQAGYLVVYNAQAQLHHYESKSRGFENTPEKFVRFGNEMFQMYDKWNISGAFLDPYYNPNLSRVNYYKIDYFKGANRFKKLIQYFSMRLRIAQRHLRLLRRKL